MKYLICLLVFSSVAVAQPPQAPPLRSYPFPKPPQAPPLVIRGVIPKPLTYREARMKAIRENLPLLVFVGVEYQERKGFVCCRWDGYSDTQKGIVVGVPRNQEVFCGNGDREFLSEEASDDALLKRVEEVKERIRPPMSFSAPSPLLRGFAPAQQMC